MKTLNFITEARHSSSSGTGKSKRVFIKGKAINAGVTRNKVSYQAGELHKAAKTLVDKPLLKNHTNDVDSVVGKVVSADFDGNAVTFEAEVSDEHCQKLIENDLLNSVSIGASVQSLDKKHDEINGEYAEAIGIEFLELSLVAVPSDPGALFTQQGFNNAVFESFKTIQPETTGDRLSALKIERDKLTATIADRNKELTKLQSEEKRYSKHNVDYEQLLVQHLTAA